MKRLSQQQTTLVAGGFFWAPIIRVIAPVVINSIAYVFHHRKNDEDITPTGIAIAAGTGVVSGGIGAATSIATGGSVAGIVAWAPTTAAINSTGTLIAKEH